MKKSKKRARKVILFIKAIIRLIDKKIITPIIGSAFDVMTDLNNNGEKFDFQNAHGQYTETYWRPVLRDVGILEYTNEEGQIKEHRPHDARHTFTSMWKEKKLDETYRRKIQGHSGQGIGEQVYTHIDMEKLKAELNQL